MDTGVDIGMFIESNYNSTANGISTPSGSAMSGASSSSVGPMPAGGPSSCICHCPNEPVSNSAAASTIANNATNMPAGGNVNMGIVNT